MIEYFLTILIILAAYVFYKFYYRPKRTLNWYKETLEGLGYKVNMLPFAFMGAGFIPVLLNDTEKHNDAVYSYKMEAPKYDMQLFNTLNTPVI